jgi:hypothetical protein
MKMQWLVIMVLLVLTTKLYAGEYLGFQLGTATLAQVEAQLKKSGARFNDGFGYHGYLELQTIRVDSYQTLNKFGSVKDAWLSFTPKKTLYQIDVIWHDAGELFKTFKDALDTKYGSATVSGFGFESDYAYHDGNVAITLHRSTFGFGEEQTTALTYVFTPAQAEVDAMRERIDDDIKRKHAKKAGADL